MIFEGHIKKKKSSLNSNEMQNTHSIPQTIFFLISKLVFNLSKFLKIVTTHRTESVNTKYFSQLPV